MLYLVFPLLIWAALRFGQRGATLAVAITALLTVWNTTHHSGPFHFESITRSVLSAQLFIAVTALSTLCLAAVVTEREQFATRLGASRSRLVSASDNARRRLEHDLHDGAQLRLTWLALHLRDAAGIAQREPERVRRFWRRRKASCSWRSTSCGSSRTGSIRPCSSTSASPRRSRASRCARPSRSGCSRCPTDGLTSPRDSGVLRRRRGDRQRAEVFAGLVHPGARNCSGASLRIEILDDGVGGAAERPGSGLEGLRDRAEAIGGSMELVSHHRRPGHRISGQRSPPRRLRPSDADQLSSGCGELAVPAPGQRPRCGSGRRALGAGGGCGFEPSRCSDGARGRSGGSNGPARGGVAPRPVAG